MAKQFDTTELDFDEIKNTLKGYFKNHPSGAYDDWDFEGSGVNHLLDILAYNTHYNAVNAHIAMNESFLDSAQVRNNVVTRAKLLGYIPGSRIASKATLQLIFQEDDGVGGYFELPIGTKVSTTVDGITYTFITRNTYSALLEDGVFTLNGVEVYEGKTKESQFLVDAKDNEQNLVIDDETIDVNTLKVKVFDSPTSNESETYTLWTSFEGETVTGDSRIYFLSENYDGKYEVRFGNGVFGKKPPTAGVVSFEYLSTEGAIANRATIFEWADADPEPIINVTSPSSFGSEREDIESIRFNAPTTFATQDRAVTASDYRTLIKSEFKDIENMAVWGGQDNNPPQYGKCFISIKPPAAETLSDQQKDDIIALLNRKRVITVIPEIVDPTFTYLFFEILFKYDSTKTILTSGELITRVRSAINTYNETILTKFDGVFRFSEFLNVIDNADVSILNTTVRIDAYKTVDLIYGALVPQTIDFDFPLSGKIDQPESFMSSDPWTYLGNSLQIADEYIEGVASYRRVYAFRIDANGNIVKVLPDLGKLYPETGLIELNPVAVQQNETINMYVEPKSNDVASKRNNLISIDVNKIKFTPEIDTIAVSGSVGAVNYRTFDKN